MPDDAPTTRTRAPVNSIGSTPSGHAIGTGWRPEPDVREDARHEARRQGCARHRFDPWHRPHHRGDVRAGRCQGRLERPLGRQGREERAADPRGRRRGDVRPARRRRGDQRAGGRRRDRRRLRADHDAHQQRGADRARERELQAGHRALHPGVGRHPARHPHQHVLDLEVRDPAHDRGGRRVDRQHLLRWFRVRGARAVGVQRGEGGRELPDAGAGGRERGAGHPLQHDHRRPGRVLRPGPRARDDEGAAAGREPARHRTCRGLVGGRRVGVDHRQRDHRGRGCPLQLLAAVTDDAAALSELARRHLWMHFSRLGSYDADTPVHVIARGEGCHVWDATGHRLLDGLSGLFTVQVGHGRSELAEAARTQVETLDYFPLWTYAHPPAIELAARLAHLAPGDLSRVFFTSGGSEAVEAAWKLARQYFRAIGQGQRHKVIARRTAYHGTTLGALAVTGVPALRTPFEPLTPGAVHVANTNRRRHPLGDDEKAFMLALTDEIEDRILFEGPETVAAVFLEPVQNAGGCLVPPEGYFPRVREICDRHGVLLVSDEVICAFGRLGTTFACDRYDYLPDIITCAKGLTSGYSPLGAVICRDFLAEPFLEDKASFAHGLTFGGHPVSCAVGVANLGVFEQEHVLDNVLAHEAGFRERLEHLRDLPIVGDVRGAGYFQALEMVPDPASDATFTAEQREELLRGFLLPRFYEAGLIARADDRGDPVVQLAPPLVARDAELDELADVLRAVLTEASARFCV